MIPQNEAKIFPAKNRGLTEFNWLKSCSTFNVENDNISSAAEPIFKLKDDVLAPDKSLKINAEEDADIMLLPVAGTIICYDHKKKGSIVEAGNAQFFSVKKNDCIEIINPYEDEFINFLHLWIRPGFINTTANASHLSFELDSNKNKLNKLFNDEQDNSVIRFYIGKFDGRSEALYKVSKPGNAVFVFIIDGAFEVQYRLLETRDALILWNLQEAEIEALSNNAVILLAEMPCS